MYAVLKDLTKQLPEDLLIQLTDDDGQGMVDASKAEDAIAMASAEIDGWCGSRFVVPFNPVPALIRKCAIDMALYNLFARRLETVPETRNTRYKEALRLLEKIACGQVELSSTALAVAAAPEAEGCFVGSERLFCRKSLQGL